VPGGVEDVLLPWKNVVDASALVGADRVLRVGDTRRIWLRQCVPPDWRGRYGGVPRGLGRFHV